MKEIDVNQLLVLTQEIHHLADKAESLAAEAPRYTKEDLKYFLNKVSDHLKCLSVTIRDLEEFFI